ncbi:unnamed protein product [Cladocopium goreaui]|uniref:Calcium-dependent protein kinase 2 n=1 Tax=Cladocopium goreaui TaxID=2562237 RepID=A0A9P1CB00_9DINO|nr:unnamed protein product [Cladocopium goreaui]
MACFHLRLVSLLSFHTSAEVAAELQAFWQEEGQRRLWPKNCSEKWWQETDEWEGLSEHEGQEHEASEKREVGQLQGLLQDARQSKNIHHEVAELVKGFRDGVDHGPPVAAILADSNNGINDAMEKPVAASNKTLAGILQEAGLAGGSRLADSQDVILQRAIALRPKVIDLCNQMRICEGELSRTQINGNTPQLSQHNQRMHAVALARQAFQQQTGRQSRASLWMDHQSKILQKFNNKDSKEGASDAVVHTVKEFVPCGWRFESNGSRQYQIVLVRNSRHGHIYLALVTSVFRGALFRKHTPAQGATTFRPKLSASPIPADCTARVHVVLLQPRKCGNVVLLEASCVSYAMSLDPHDEDFLVVGQMSQNALTISETDSKLKVEMALEAWQVVREMREAPIAAIDSRLGPRPIYTTDSFSNSVKGRSNLENFLGDLKKLHEEAGASLVDKEGRVKALAGKPLFTHLVLRASGFFALEWRTKKTSADKLEYGTWVLQRLRACLPSPSPASQASRFEKLLLV